MALSVKKLRLFFPRKLVYASVFTVVVMAAVELAVRVLWHPAVVGAERYMAISPSFDFGFEITQPLCLDQGDSWLCIPTQYRNQIRRQRLARNKPEDTIRFITLGGSVSAGGPESYTHLLRDELEDLYSAVHWESLNLSNHGYGSTRMRVLMENVPQLDPDFIILDSTGTNEYEDERDRYRKDYLNSGLGAVLYRSRALVLAKKMLVPRFAVAGMGSGPRYPGPAEKEANTVKENVERWLSTLDRNLSEMVKIAHKHDISVVLMGRSIREPITRGSRYDRINKNIRSHVDDVNVLYVDTHGALHQQEQSGRFYREDGLHINCTGHAALAQVLARRVVPGLPRIAGRVEAISKSSRNTRVGR